MEKTQPCQKVGFLSWVSQLGFSVYNRELAAIARFLGFFALADGSASESGNRQQS